MKYNEGGLVPRHNCLCPTCTKPIPCLKEVDGKVQEIEEGDYSICLYCKCIVRFETINERRHWSISELFESAELHPTLAARRITLKEHIALVNNEPLWDKILLKIRIADQAHEIASKISRIVSR